MDESARETERFLRAENQRLMAALKEAEAGFGFARAVYREKGVVWMGSTPEKALYSVRCAILGKEEKK